MAIASVARKATIRRDDTLLKTSALIENQKKVGKQLELQQQKIEADRAEAKIKRSAANLKMALATGDIKDSYYAKGFVPLMARFQKMNAEGALQVDIENQIAKMDNYTKVANTAFQNSQQIIDGIAGTESQRELRNKDEVIKRLSEYNEKTALTDWDQVEAQEYANAGRATYNTQKSMEVWGEKQQEHVNESLNIKVGTINTQIETTVQASRLWLIDPDTKRVAVGNNGLPTMVISNEQLASFKANRGHKLAIEDYIEENTKTETVGRIGEDGNPEVVTEEVYKPTELEAMEALVRESGIANIDENTTTKVIATRQAKTDPQLKIDAENAEAMKHVSSRLDFLQDPQAIMGVLNNPSRGVLTEATRKIKGIVQNDKDGKPIVDKTGSADIKDADGKVIGKEYTIVIDTSKLKNETVLGVPVESGGVQGLFSIEELKSEKIQVVKIQVDNKAPLKGLIQLSTIYNATVTSKQRVDHQDIRDEWNRREGIKTEKAAADEAEAAAAKEKADAEAKAAEVQKTFPNLVTPTVETDSSKMVLGQKNGFPVLGGKKN